MTKKSGNNYVAVNKDSWNRRVPIHYESSFYDVKGFVAGNSSLNSIELELLGDLKGKSVLHLQCHFGQDSISLSRLGAKVVGVDFSDKAIDLAKQLALKTASNATFICCDLYDLPEYLDGQFDVVFTSYGTIGWLPDLSKWGSLVSRYLKPNGVFIMVDFHPVLWMLDDDFSYLKYSYFNREMIVEEEMHTYAEPDKAVSLTSVCWNHPISDLLNALIKHNLTILSFKEFDYSPYDCFNETQEKEPGKFVIKHLDSIVPMVYSIKAQKEQIIRQSELLPIRGGKK